MKRRKFIHYGALANASFLGNLALINCQPSAALFSREKMNNKQHYDWIILYWMPYDNDLSPFGSPILQMLTKGVQSDNILVVVQSDFLGANNLSRSIIAKDKFEVQQLNTANSASEEVFAEYLNWANSQFVSNNWVITFLGHGGHLDEISPDINTGTVQLETQWMNIKKLSDEIGKFNKKINTRVELLFFQNCNKGTIEAHYTFRDVANYTLSSQRLLGAPNYY
ncbi:MAG TPA: clostripain-related cysteine peptidase, partial [Kamptonema sp.]|nr:clostripain-related cysteine peptidase [Kamptonema sp.]